MVGVAGVDEERSDKVPKQSEGNPAKVSNPIFTNEKNEP